MNILRKTTVYAILTILFLSSCQNILASNYGEGVYGTGNYSENTAPTPTPVPPTTTPIPNNNSDPNTSTSPSTNNNSQVSPPHSSGCHDSISQNSPDLFEIRTGKNTATLYFAPPTSPYSSFYLAYSRKQNDWEYGTEYNQGYSGGVLKYTIYSLQPNTKYYFKIRAGNGCATGNWSNIMSAITTNSSTKTKTQYKNILLSIFKPKQTAVKKFAQTIVAATPKNTTNKNEPTTPNPSPTIIPTQTTAITKKEPTPTLKPVPIPKKKFCILWWCF